MCVYGYISEPETLIVWEEIFITKIRLTEKKTKVLVCSFLATMLQFLPDSQSLHKPNYF